MAICSQCCPWNLPLVWGPQKSSLGVPIPMPFQDWLRYHLHVVLHQAGNWSGEIEQYSDELKQQSIMTALAPITETVYT